MGKRPAFNSMRAEDLINEAWEKLGEPNAPELARSALRLDPAALDAYVILGQTLPTTIERIAILREGVRRGNLQWALAIKRPAENHFWSDIDTRPFMRAMHSLALQLWEAGDRIEAVGLAERLVRLNSNDNLGARYLLLNWLPVVGEWHAFQKVMRKCKGEQRTPSLYAACLDAFRLNAPAEAAVRRATGVNPYVVSFLADAGLMPNATELETNFGATHGSELEAFEYALASREAWKVIDGAIKSLKKMTKALSS